MFQIFRKKLYLVDYLEGFVDIHNHILPGIDDGAQTVDESMALIKGFSEIGIRNFIATPHIMDNYYPNTAITINSSLTLLKKHLAINKVDNVKIRAAAEHMIDANFEDLLAADNEMQFPDNYLLIEMSYLQASINFDQAVSKITSKGYFPILAHPERYIYLHGKFNQYQRYKADNVLFQLNLLSLGNFYGKNVQKMALKLLDADLINFVGTDVHNMRQLSSLKELQVSSKLINKLAPIIDTTSASFY